MRRFFIFPQSFSAKSQEFSQSLGEMGRFWRVGALLGGGDFGGNGWRKVQIFGEKY